MIRLICLSLMCAPAAAAAGDETRFALVMGANYGEQGDEPLRFAERDAGEMAGILTRFGAVPEENLILLQGRSAKRVEVALGVLEGRIEQARSAGHETLLFVYYSGHADASALHLGDTRLTFSKMKALVEGVGATLKVMVVDACRSGELTRVKGARPAPAFEIKANDKLTSEGNAIITSSAAGEDAQESDRLGGGIFSHHFMAGLRGAADRSEDGMVTLSEAYRYAYDENLRSTSRARFIQHPTYAFQMKGRQDLVVTRLRMNAQHGRIQLKDPGTWLLMDRSGSKRGVLEFKAQGKTEVLVTPGPYLVRYRSDEAVYEGEINIPMGQATTVDVANLGLVPYGRTVRKGYDSKRQSALGVSLSCAMSRSLSDGLSPIIVAAVGGRIDLSALSLEARFRFGKSSAENIDIYMDHTVFGADLTVMKVFDVGWVSPSFGMRLGADMLDQDFETSGQAPRRQSYLGRVGPVLRLEFPIGAAGSIGLSGLMDGVVMPGEHKMNLVTSPGGELAITVFFQ